jgi:acetyltransferase-like isoleucine patch superfamily enzyme
MNTNKVLKFLKRVNLRSVYLNFKLFPIKIAFKFPLLVSRRTLISKFSPNSIDFDCEVIPGLIQIGYGNLSVFDYKRSRSVLEITGKIIVRGHVRIGHGSKIIVTKKGLLDLGNNFMVNSESTIIATNKITIKNDVLLSWDILIMDDDLHQIIDNDSLVHINKSKEIVINEHVWIGARSMILKGSSIPSNVIIAANAIVTNSLSESNAIYGGNPVKILKRNVSWEH